MYYFEVAIVKAHTADKFFTYQSANLIPVGSVIKVPFASGCRVLSSFTGILNCCAGHIEAGCKILAPK